MSLDIAVSGISVIEGNPKIDPGLFVDILIAIDKGPYELNRVQKIAAAAVMNAISAAGIRIDEIKGERTAIFLGNTYGAEEFKIDFIKIYKTRRANLVNPSVFPFTTSNSIASWLGVQFGVKGMNLTFTSGCVSGSQAIIAGCDSLISGKADVAIVGGISLICDDLEKEFYECGFQHEFVGFMVLEREKDFITSGRKANVLIQDFRQGFMVAEDIIGLSKGKFPVELKDYCHQSNAKYISAHLGNSLPVGKVSFNEINKQNKVSEINFLNKYPGNLFSAAGVLGVSCAKEDNCVFFDIDSYGAYAAFKINAER